MTTATHFRYEIVRSFRNRVFYAVTLALPLVLFYAVASGQRHATFDGIRFPLYFMTAMAVYRAMFDVMKAIPSYWLVQAGKTALGGGSWPAQGWIVIAAWTAVLVAAAALAYRRSAARG